MSVEKEEKKKSSKLRLVFLISKFVMQGGPLDFWEFTLIAKTAYL